MIWKIAILVCTVFVAVGVVLYVNGGRAERANNPLITSERDTLVVSPQDSRISVAIDSATLTQGGYIVVRGGDGKRLGQIIEISQYLEAGKHKNITVELGDFYVYDEADRLIAMIYRDDGDKSFSELDQPVNASALFAKTGQSVPLSVFEQQVALGGGMGMETVRYNDSGFQPEKLIVPIGTMIEFINQSDKEMWVASNVHPSHEILPTFDQFKGVGKGKSYMYTFDQKGVWAYHDHINPSFEGVITVQ